MQGEARGSSHLPPGLSACQGFARVPGRARPADSDVRIEYSADACLCSFQVPVVIAVGHGVHDRRRLGRLGPWQQLRTMIY